MVWPNPLLTKFGIDHRLESCVTNPFSNFQLFPEHSADRHWWGWYLWVSAPLLADRIPIPASTQDGEETHQDPKRINVTQIKNGNQKTQSGPSRESKAAILNCRPGYVITSFMRVIKKKNCWLPLLFQVSNHIPTQLSDISTSWILLVLNQHRVLIGRDPVTLSQLRRVLIKGKLSLHFWQKFFTHKITLAWKCG